MRKTIKNRDGCVIGVWVAKTARGFNKKHKAEIAKALNTAPTKARVFVVHTKK